MTLPVYITLWKTILFEHSFWQKMRNPDNNPQHNSIKRPKFIYHRWIAAFLCCDSASIPLLWFRCKVSAPYEQMFFLLSTSELSPLERDDESHAKTPLSTAKKIHICEPCLFDNPRAFPVAVGNNRKPPEIWLTAAKNASCDVGLNFRVRMLLKTAVTLVSIT